MIGDVLNMNMEIGALASVLIRNVEFLPPIISENRRIMENVHGFLHFQFSLWMHYLSEGLVQIHLLYFITNPHICKGLNFLQDMG